MLDYLRARNASRKPFQLNTALKPIALATLLTLSHHALAESPNAEIKLDLDAIPVTGNPLGVSSDELVVPVSVLNGRELSLQRQQTIGATLSNIPGVVTTQFGPNVARPMIRGLDADRVRIMQNGVGALDVSNVSGDHAVAIDPLVIEQIDVVRGPAALLYGGNAMGGAVNAIDHRIPTEAVDGFLGRAETRFGGPNNLRSGAAVFDFGNERFSMHVDGYYRKTDDLKIPGYNISDNLFNQEEDDHDEDHDEHEEEHDDDHDEDHVDEDHDEDEHEETERTKGRLANSDGKQTGGAIGGTIHFENGYIGTSYAVTENNYGVVAFDDVRIDLESKRWDLASKFFDLGGWIQRTKVKLAYTDYEHVELEGSEVGTSFDTKGWQGTFEAGHVPIGKLNGVIGFQFADTEFSALGEEAFVPSTETKTQALYIYEELPINEHKITFGARFGNADVDSKTTEGFGAGQSRSFNPNSFAIGGVYQINQNWSFATNVSHNERAPSHFELYANGVHVATAQFEIGNPDLKVERSNGIDAQIRWKSGKHSFNVSAYYTDFDNFISLFDTGVVYEEEEEDHDEDEEEHDHGHGGEATIANFRAVPARFKGIEFQGKYQASTHIAINVRGDYVNAKETDNNTYLPRIAPARLGLGANYQKGALNARFDVLHAFDQNKTADNELATDGYTNVTALVAYKLPTKWNVELFARANNLLDDEIRDHSSFLKDIAPAGERSLVVGARADF